MWTGGWRGSLLGLVRLGHSCRVKLVAMVMAGRGAVVSSGHGEHSVDGRGGAKRVRDAQPGAQEERAQRERDNVEDMATFLRLADPLGRGRRVGSGTGRPGVRGGGPPGPHEHRGAAGAALVRMRDRGETISVIAARRSA